MQWQHQVCPSGLPDGMAVALAEETLRALQDALSIHEIVLTPYATATASPHFRTSAAHTRGQIRCDFDAISTGSLCLAWMATLGYESSLAHALLDCRWGMDFENGPLGP